ncbi:uncharacterized protein LOC116403915 [Cucumis sativus]|uniref:uncharacterized protein LOC116403915 n=1 Tax=Cucumis sativus TaxID=3659 RepID=UPI0012F4BE78|nr:uncharacterized protein LOC116403915 [Cucumis sativus]
MANLLANGIVEGQSTSRPPYFDGSNYAYWKARMKIYLQSIDYNLWLIVAKGPYVPMKNVDNVDTPKLEEEYDENEMKKCSFNAKAINCLYCALSKDEFNRISMCSSAQEIWNTLEITHEGTNQVKESKISMFVHNYELFKMDANETITDMFTRFTNIINALKGLGKVYTTSENVRKILRSLPKTWEAKVTAIQEAKDLTKLPLEELIGSLMTHEIIMKEHLEDESKKKKSIALKTISLEVDPEDEDGLDEDDIAYFSRKYKNFIKRKKYFKKHLSTQKESKGEKSKKDEVICYECKRSGHIRTDCPLLKSSKKSKKKAMKATWDDSSESESEVEEMANLGLMAHSDKDDEHDDKVTLEPLSIDELFENFESMQNDLEKLSSKYVVLKKKYNVLISENKSLLDTIACFKENENFEQIEELNVSSDKHVCIEKDALLDKVRFLEHDSCEKDNLIKVLKENELSVLQELDKAKETIKKLTIGAQRLDKIIEVGKSYGDKRGLGYIDESSTPSSSKTTFVKASPIVPKFNMSNHVSNHVKSSFVPICHNCGVEGHIRPKCFKLKYAQNTYSRRNFSQRAKFYIAPRKNFSNKSRVHKFVMKNKSLHNVVCFSCGKYGHKAYSCYLSRSSACNVYEKMKWIPKYVNANILGPKQVWVPKDQT